MKNRQEHQAEVCSFLKNHIANREWEISLPRGWGNESYFANSSEQHCFIKLDIQVERYQAAGAIGLTAPVLASGTLPDGTTILVQQFIEGRKPLRSDCRRHLAEFAAAIDQLHHSQDVQMALPQPSFDIFSSAGMKALTSLREKWELFKPQVPRSARFIDESLEVLERQIGEFKDVGLVASHNDINNSNWRLSSNGRLFLLDLESMSMDDPALDIGATLWWYYPPEMREEFLQRTGYLNDAEFQKRMRVRMSMHCLNILLPREGSFDQFDAVGFDADLVDFRACLAGEDNPQGFED